MKAFFKKNSRHFESFSIAIIAKDEAESRSVCGHFSSLLLTVIFNKEIQNKVLEILTEKKGDKHSIKKITPVSGGSINDAYKLETDRGNFFVKKNSAVKYPLMFEAEAKGLELLRSANEIYIPEPIATSLAGQDAFIIMEYAEQGKRQKDFFFDFGKRVAKLHKHSAEKFGLDSRVVEAIQSHHHDTDVSEHAHKQEGGLSVEAMIVEVFPSSRLF